MSDRHDERLEVGFAIGLGILIVGGVIYAIWEGVQEYGAVDLVLGAVTVVIAAVAVCLGAIVAIYVLGYLAVDIPEKIGGWLER